MKHPGILLLAVMMFADYFLTILGAIHRENGYSTHFTTEHYELNPIWQKSVARKKWFNPRHTLLVIVLTSALVLMFEFGDLPNAFVDIAMGVLLVFYGMMVGRHVNNLLLFRHLARHPLQISGKVTMAHELALFISLYQTVLVAVPVAIIAAYSRSDFAIGGIIGIALFPLVNLRWILNARKIKPVTLDVPPPPG